jgi:tryptophan synthase alpha chain
MSSRITNTFRNLKEKNEGALVAFITAGDPSLEHTSELIALIADAGADIIELGIPYSDPLADGPVIQASSQRALDRGITPPMVLEMVRESRKLTGKPIALMTSYNLVLQYGLEKFAAEATAAGADGAILTDLPPEEASAWKNAAEASGMDTIFLVAPTSTSDRIKLIGRYSRGFVYCVSRTGVTGTRNDVPTDLVPLLAQIRAATDTPACIGFGISRPEHVAQVCAMADGAVIGSALVEFLNANTDNPTRDSDLRQLIGDWKNGTKRN